MNTYSQNSMTGERRPSASMQVPLKRVCAVDRFNGAVSERLEESIGRALDDVRTVVWLWQWRRKSCVQLGVFQECPQVAQGSGFVKE